MGRWLGIIALLLIVGGPAWAAEAQIAQIKTVSGAASIVRGGVALPVKIGDPVYQSDVIKTGAGGSIGLTFTDNTVFSTGPDSEVALADYHFDSNNFRGQMLAEMRKGTLLVTSGDIAHSSPDAMKIKTPTGIMGVRGTTFEVKVY